MILNLVSIRVIACVTIVRVFLSTIMNRWWSSLANLVCCCWPLSQITRYLRDLIVAVSTTWSLSPWTKAWRRYVSLNNPCILLRSRNVRLFTHFIATIPLILHATVAVGNTSAKFRISGLFSVKSFSTVASLLVDIAILSCTWLVLSWVVVHRSWQSWFVCWVWPLPCRMSIVTILITTFRRCFIGGGSFRRSPIVIGMITTSWASVPVGSRRIRIVCHACSLTWALSCCRCLSSTTKVWICIVLIQTSFKFL